VRYEKPTAHGRAVARPAALSVCSTAVRHVLLLTAKNLLFPATRSGSLPMLATIRRASSSSERGKKEPQAAKPLGVRRRAMVAGADNGQSTRQENPNRDGRWRLVGRLATNVSVG
jgi:hypothetical protein